MRIVTICAAALLMTAVAACSSNSTDAARYPGEGPTERIGRNVDQSAQSASNNFGEALEDTGRSIERGKNKVW